MDSPGLPRAERAGGRPARSAGRDLNPEEDIPGCSLTRFAALPGCDFQGFKSGLRRPHFPDADCSRRVAVAPRRSPCCVGKNSVDSPGLSERRRRSRGSASPRLSERSERRKWTRRDLNPGPLPCEGSDLPLIYEPATVSCPQDRLYLAFHRPENDRERTRVSAATDRPRTSAYAAPSSRTISIETSLGTWIRISWRSARSSASMSMSRLWTRISQCSHVAVPGR